MPNQTDPSSNQVTTPVAPAGIPMHTDLPPLPDSMTQSSSPAPLPPTPDPTLVAPINQSTNQPIDNSSGSGAPPDMPSIVSTPKKKFGGGKIIATILGLFLLVGGVGAGIILTQQQQTLQPKASIGSGNLGLGNSSNANGTSGTGGNGLGSGSSSIGSASNQGSSGASGTGGSKTGSSSSGSSGSGASGSGGGTVGINTQTDKNNCGGKGNVCGAGYTCSLGQCVISGVSGSGGGTVGINLQTDSKNCGSVGFACGTGTSCSNGQCVSSGISGVGGGTVGLEVCGKTYCSNGYKCTNGVCTANAETTSCGRNTDTGAPVCCTDACQTTPVCEGGTKRQECVTNGKYCTIQSNSSSCGGANSGGGTTTTTTAGATAVCSGLKAYSSTWTLLTAANLSALKSGTIVNFCATGSASSGAFDKARFTINGVLQTETTTKGSDAAASDFCQSYTIPVSVTTFNIKAELHHPILGWF